MARNLDVWLWTKEGYITSLTHKKNDPLVAPWPWLCLIGHQQVFARPCSTISEPKLQILWQLSLIFPPLNFCCCWNWSIWLLTFVNGSNKTIKINYLAEQQIFLFIKLLLFFNQSCNLDFLSDLESTKNLYAIYFMTKNWNSNDLAVMDN